MIRNKALDRIQSGDASAQEARKTLREALAAVEDTGSAAIYAALRSWTWKALLGRRFDSEMEEWFKLLRNTAAHLSKRDDKAGIYIEALTHLVDESLRYGASHSRDLLVSRSHIGELLDLLRVNNGRSERAFIESRMGLKSSRLSQILTELTVAGALNRERDGKHATFVLTDEGRALLEMWVPVSKALPAAPPPPVTMEPEVEKEKYPPHLFPEQERLNDGNPDRLEAMTVELAKFVEQSLSQVDLTPDDLLARQFYRSTRTKVEPANENGPDWAGSYDMIERRLEEPQYA